MIDPDIHTIVLDTKSAVQNNSVYNFTMPIEIKHIDKFKLNRVIIPNRFQTVRIAPAQNNMFTLTPFGGVPGAYAIPVGNYNPTSLALAIQTRIKLFDPNYTCTYNSLTNKLMITNPVTNFTITAPDYFNYLTGFVSTTVMAAFVIGTYTVNLGYTPYVTMHSDFLSKYIYYNKHVDNRTSMITVFPVSGSFGDNITYECINPRWYSFDSKSDIITYIDIWFEDEYGEVIDFSNSTCLIEFDMIKGAKV